jgi:hypothetical protein
LYLQYRPSLFAAKSKREDASLEAICSGSSHLSIERLLGAGFGNAARCNAKAAREGTGRALHGLGASEPRSAST